MSYIHIQRVSPTCVFNVCLHNGFSSEFRKCDFWMQTVKQTSGELSGRVLDHSLGGRTNLKLQI